ncbi:hypothetical protein BJ742DRAFT_795071 [Cladochytrium replicatum]|nr:hypothetical protein BJ742DRAFT_795071 [Cladochytrium replicatum]
MLPPATAALYITNGALELLGAAIALLNPNFLISDSVVVAAPPPSNESKPLLTRRNRSWHYAERWSLFCLSMGLASFYIGVSGTQERSPGFELGWLVYHVTMIAQRAREKTNVFVGVPLHAGIAVWFAYTLWGPAQ